VIRYRDAVAEDSRVCYEVLRAAVGDLVVRMNFASDSEEFPDAWDRRRPLYQHLAATGDRWAVAEEDDRVVGYARSIVRDTERELTEFFVRPDVQSGGIGKELIGRVFPAEAGVRRTIVATPDLRALSRYLRLGPVGVSAIVEFRRSPRDEPMESDLEVVRLEGTDAELEALAGLDREVIGHRRDVDHRWLIEVREGLMFRRSGTPVGYGYAGMTTGPALALDQRDQPAILSRLEAVCAQAGEALCEVEVPMVNGVAMRYLLEGGFRMDPFLAFFLADGTPPALDRYVLHSPPFFY
jgi:hypothetical protein